MPSWVTHLVTANKVCEKLDIKDKNSFLFGNIMPDILNNYIIKKTSSHVDYEITHFTNDVIINGIKYAFPNHDKFLEKYKDQIKNPVVCGYYIHLLTDYFWNKMSYETYFRERNNLVELQLVDGTTEIYEFVPAIKVKQLDFKIFTEYLKENNLIDEINYTDNLLQLSNKIEEIPLTKEDIEKAIYEVIRYMENKPEDTKYTYRLFTQDILNKHLQDSINFIVEKINNL